jgi:hypothetical protein
VDIAGAKALKKRLGSKRAQEAPPIPVDVPADAPPVFHWLGVSRSTPETPQADDDDEPAAAGASLFQRLGLSFR